MRVRARRARTIDRADPVDIDALYRPRVRHVYAFNYRKVGKRAAALRDGDWR